MCVTCAAARGSHASIKAKPVSVKIRWKYMTHKQITHEQSFGRCSLFELNSQASPSVHLTCSMSCRLLQTVLAIHSIAQAVASHCFIAHPVAQLLMTRPRDEWRHDVTSRYRALEQFSKEDARLQFLRILRSLPYGMFLCIADLLAPVVPLDWKLC